MPVTLNEGDPGPATRFAHSWAWKDVNPVLPDGEVGQEDDTGRKKVGDGKTRWNRLEYYTPPNDVEPGTVIETNPEPNTGIKIDEESLRAYNDAGVVTVQIDAETGRILAVGDISTGLVGDPRVRLVDIIYQGSAEALAEFYSGYASEVFPGYIKGHVNDAIPAYYLTLAPPGGTGSERPTIVLQTGTSGSSGVVIVNSTRILLDSDDIDVGTFDAGSVGTGTFQESVANSMRKDGNYTGNTNASGEVTISHFFGQTTYRVFCMNQENSGNKVFAVINKAFDTFTVQIRNGGNPGTLQASTSVNFDWLCIT